MRVKPPQWRQPDGAPVSCIEKLKVLNENLGEIEAICQEALEDGVLMGCDETQFCSYLHALVDGLVNPYKRG
ncbi:MAG: hypothetical protein EXQ88_04105 [Alphaproteobacteria bacterium]|nr:hypothetical protein [Alphaproteobacteria bacterium]